MCHYEQFAQKLPFPKILLKVEHKPTKFNGLKAFCIAFVFESLNASRFKVKVKKFLIIFTQQKVLHYNVPK